MDAALEAALAKAPSLRPYADTGSALLAYVQPTMLRGPRHGFCAAAWTVTGLQIAMVALSVYLMIRIIGSGNYWVFRRVKVRRGWIIVPSSSNAAALFWLAYTLLDVSCRGLILRVYCYHGTGVFYMMLPILLRYGACFWAAICHVASSALIWPLSPATVHPLLWHLFLFGITGGLMAGALFPIIMTSYYFEKGCVTYVALERSLISGARFDVPPLPSDIEMAAKILRVSGRGAQYLQGLAALAAICAFAMFIFCILIGRVLLGRLWSAEKSLARDDDEAGTTSILPYKVFAGEAGQNKDSEERATKFPSPKRASFSRIRRPRGSDPTRERLDQAVPVVEVRRLFRRFFLHLLVETSLIGFLGLAVTVVLVWTSITVVSAFADHGVEPPRDNRAGLWFYQFLTMEMWTFMIIGNAYALSVLSRQAAPLRLDTMSGHIKVDKEGSLPNRTTAPPSRVDVQITEDVVHHISAAEKHSVLRDLTQGRLGQGRVQKRGSQVSDHPGLIDDCSSTLECFSEDPTGFAGRGLGRSLVLEALAPSKGSTLMDRIATVDSIRRSTFQRKSTVEHPSAVHRLATDVPGSSWDVRPEVRTRARRSSTNGSLVRSPPDTSSTDLELMSMSDVKDGTISTRDYIEAMPGLWRYSNPDDGELSDSTTASEPVRVTRRPSSETYEHIIHSLGTGSFAGEPGSTDSSIDGPAVDWSGNRNGDHQIKASTSSVHFT